MLGRPHEHVHLDARRHVVVLVRPLARAAALAALGTVGFAVGWPASAAGAVLLVAAAAIAVAAVWSWDRAHVVLTSESLCVAHGLLRRRAAAVHLAHVRVLEVEQSLLGRVLGYGTLVAGDLEISCVARPGEVYGLVERAMAPLAGATTAGR
jgi:uncharacterized membrane protein YdbT with pleckstrin-like domain